MICEITTGDDPSFVTVTVVLALCPTWTDPNATVCVDTVSSGGALVVFETDAIGAVHPEKTTQQVRSAKAPTCRRANLPEPAQKGGRNTLEKGSKVTMSDYRCS